VAAEFAQFGDEVRDFAVKHPAVGRKVDRAPGLLVAEQAAVEPVAERRAGMPPCG
jgi:hypothetical protein